MLVLPLQMLLAQIKYWEYWTWFSLILIIETKKVINKELDYFRSWRYDFSKQHPKKLEFSLWSMNSNANFHSLKGTIALFRYLRLIFFNLYVVERTQDSPLQPSKSYKGRCRNYEPYMKEFEECLLACANEEAYPAYCINEKCYCLRKLL